MTGVRVTIHDPTPRVRLDDAPAKGEPGIRGALVALVQASLIDDESGLGVPDHEVGVLPGRDRSLPCVDGGQARRRGAQPLRHAIDRYAAGRGACPDGRQAELARPHTSPAATEIPAPLPPRRAPRL